MGKIAEHRLPGELVAQPPSEVYVSYWDIGPGRIVSGAVSWDKYVRLWSEGFLKFQMEKEPKPEHYPTLEKALAFSKLSHLEVDARKNDVGLDARARNTLRTFDATPIDLTKRSGRIPRSSPYPHHIATREYTKQPTLPTVAVSDNQPKVSSGKHHAGPLSRVVVELPEPKAPVEVPVYPGEMDWESVCTKYPRGYHYGNTLPSGTPTLEEIVRAIVYMRERLSMDYETIGNRFSSSNIWAYNTHRLRTLAPEVWKYAYPKLPANKCLSRSELERIAKLPEGQQVDQAIHCLRAR